MAYILVEDFRTGLDRRKSILTAPAGSLYTLINAVITRGGEIEKRKSFVPWRTLPAGTVGLAATAVNGIYVFGDPAAFPFAERRVYTPPQASVEQLLELQRDLHLDRVVVVQPSVYGADNA